MLNMLTKIFSAKQSSLNAKLIGVAGFTGIGTVDYTGYATNHSDLSVKVKGIAGLKAALHLNDKHLADLTIKNGRIYMFADSRQGENIPALTEGDRVAIHQNGDVVLEGILTNH